VAVETGNHDIPFPDPNSHRDPWDLEPVAVRADFPPVLPFKTHTLAHGYLSGKNNTPVTPARILGKKLLGPLEQYRNTFTRQAFNLPVFRSSCHPVLPWGFLVFNVRPSYMIYPLTIPRARNPGTTL
jgi:hypothetical protein